MARSYPMPVVTRAREHSEAGWKPGKIALLLKKEFGLTISVVTVRRWVDPDYADRQRRSQDQSEWKNRWGWKRRLRRIRELRDAEITFDAIAKLLRLDFDLDLSKTQVERLARGELSSEATRRLLGGEA